MKTKSIEIEGKVYEVRELTLEEGMPLLAKSSGKLDMVDLIKAATRVDGRDVGDGEVSFSAALQIMPIVLELNSFVGAAAGNG